MRNKMNNEKIEQLKRANAMLFQNKACPQCGARLAVCKKPYNSESFPVLNIVDASIESQYYCPICEQYYEGKQELNDWNNIKTEKFESDGKKYRFSKEFASRRILRTFLLLSIGAAAMTPLFVINISRVISGSFLSGGLMSVLSGVPLFVLAYFAIYYFKMMRVCKRAFIEPATSGVIFCNGASVEYIPWQDFRIGSTVSSGDVENGFAFDTVTTSFIVNQNMEDYKALAMEIADKIKDIAKLDPKILHLVYA